jgi:hypothetical protein
MTTGLYFVTIDSALDLALNLIRENTAASIHTTDADDFLILTISSEPKDDPYIEEMLAPFLLLII